MLKRFALTVAMLLVCCALVQAATHVKYVHVFWYENGSSKDDLYNSPSSTLNINFDPSSEITIRIFKIDSISSAKYWCQDVNNGVYKEKTSSETYEDFRFTPAIDTRIFASVDNNEGSVSIFAYKIVPQFPDLTVSSIRIDGSITPRTYEVGEEVRVECIVWNNGSNSAGASYLGCYLGSHSTDMGNRWGRYSVDSISGGGGKSKSEYYTFQSSDVDTSRYFVFKADDLDQVDEGSNEGNNIASFGPFAVISNPPVISVTPGSLTFNQVTVGSSSDLNFTVKNTGGGILSGSASVSSPFSIVSGGSYSLGSQQSQTVTVRFSPTAAQYYSQSVNFTGGGGASRTVTGTGYIETYSISGEITHPGGGGIEGVNVTAGSGTDSTAWDGSYNISELPAGTYSVTPNMAGYTFNPASLPVNVGPNAANIDFTGTCNASPSVRIEAPSFAQVNEPFSVDVYLKNTGANTSGKAYLDISFPENPGVSIDSYHSGWDEAPGLYPAGSTALWHADGYQMDPSDHIHTLVSGVRSGMNNGDELWIKLGIVPQSTGTLNIRYRGTIGDKRDPISGIEDQQGWFAEVYSISIGGATLDYSVKIMWWDDTSNGILGDNLGAYCPLRWAHVELYDSDFASVQFIDSGTLDETGSHTFRNIQSDDPGGPDLFVKIVMDCSIVGFFDFGLADLYTQTDENVTESKNSTEFLDGYEQSTYAYVYNTIQDLHAKWSELTGYNIPQVSVRILPDWLPSDWAYYEMEPVPFTDYNRLTLGYDSDPSKSQAWDKYIIAHEYAHHIMYKVYGDEWPPGAEGSKHVPMSETDMAFAMVEGWAEFVQNVLFSDWQSALNGTNLGLVNKSEYGVWHSFTNIETNNWWMGTDIDLVSGQPVNPNGNPGSIVEGAVASILWDIFDDSDSDEPQGGIDDGLSKIWSVISADPHPGHIVAFHERFVCLYPSDEAALAAIFSAHGIPIVETPITVPYYNQGVTNWCALNSAAMLMKFYGREKKPWEIAHDSRFYYTITEGPSALQWEWASDIDELGSYIAGNIPNGKVLHRIFGTQEPFHDITLLKNYLISELSIGRPVFLGSREAKHAVVVVGYDSENVYINDPSGALFGSGQCLISENMSWVDFENKLYGYFPASQVHTLSVVSDTDPSSELPLTISLLSYVNEKFNADLPIIGGHLVNTRSSIFFQNQLGGKSHRLQLKFDGSENWDFGYRFVPTTWAGVEDFEIESNPDNYYQAMSDSEPPLGYAASLGDHLYLKFPCSNSGGDTDATVELAILELDGQGSISNSRAIFTDRTSIHFGEAQARCFDNFDGDDGSRYVVLPHFNFYDRDPRGDNQKKTWASARLASLLDRSPYDGDVDNPSGRYRLIVTISGHSGQTDGIEIDFVVRNSDYSWIELLNFPNSHICNPGQTTYVPFSAANYGTLLDKPNAKVIQENPESPAMAFSFYEDANSDDLPDGLAFADTDGDNMVNLPPMQTNTIRNCLLGIHVPETMNSTQIGTLWLVLSSANDPEEKITFSISLTFDEDNVLPDTTYNSVEGYWYNTNPILDIDFSDNLALDNVYYQIGSNDDSNPQNWHNLTSDGTNLLPGSQNNQGNSLTTDWKISDDDWGNLPLNAQNQGKHYIYFKATDDAGNTCITQDQNEAFELRKDVYKPNVSILSPSSGEVLNSPDVTVEWHSDDLVLGLGLSDLEMHHYALDQASTFSQLGPNVKTIDLQGLTDGGHTFYIKAKDNAGNWSDLEQVSFIVQTQTTNRPPMVASVLPAGGEFRDDVPLDTASSDPDTGDSVTAEKYEYSLDGSTWHAIGTDTSPGNPYPWNSGLNSPSVQVRAKAYDGELWSTDWVNSGSFLVDNLAPSTTDNVPAGWQTADFTITLIPDDSDGSAFDGSGTTYYSADGTSPNIEGTSILISTSGIRTVKYYSVDDVGNEEAVKTAENQAMLDKEAPVYENWSQTDLKSTYTGDMVVTVDVMDSVSGLGSNVPQLDYRIGQDSYDGFEPMTPAGDNSWSFSIPEPSGGWGSRSGETLYYIVRSSDIAGNIGNSSEQSEYIQQSQILYVSPTGDDSIGNGSESNPWRTIGHAVSEASSEDVIKVMDDDNEATDDYVENVVVSKSLIIQRYNDFGPNPRIKASDVDNHVFMVTSDNSAIKGLDVYDGGHPERSDISGICLYSVSGCTIQANRCGWDNDHKNAIGIFLNYSSNNNISGNTCSSTECGILLELSNDNTISDNTIILNQYQGISLGNSCNNNTISGNNCSLNGWCIMYVYDSSDNNRIYLNNFDSPTRFYLNYGSSNIWRSPTKLDYSYQGSHYQSYLGNYYSDYSGIDSNSDGIGDTPYYLPSGESDEYPLMYPWSYDPASGEITINLPTENKTIYVALNGDDNSGDGSEDNPYRTIQKGINEAIDGDTVMVVGGASEPYIYKGQGNVNLDFIGKAITVKSSSGPENCIIDCESIDGTRGFYFRSGESSDSVLDGFTMRNGRAGFGVGIRCDYSSPTIVNNIITGNEVTGYDEGMAGGSGIGCRRNSAAIIINNVIKGNKYGNGGGICCHSSPAKIIGNVVEGNIGYGGGISCVGSNAEIANNVINGNNNSGILCTVSKAKIAGNIITNNSGGGFFAGGITCEGGTQYEHSYSPIIMNNTIALNLDGGISCWKNACATLVNTIVWGNGPHNVFFYADLDPNVINISYSCIEGGESGIATNNNGIVNWLEGNIDANPMFIDPANSDYHLSNSSPCIGGGTDSYGNDGLDNDGDSLIDEPDEAIPETDIEGNPRPNPPSSRPDIGAYENSLGTPLDLGTDGLVAHYKLDGNSNDATGNGHDGTPVDGISWSDEGIMDGCVSISSGHIQIGDRYDDGVMIYDENQDFTWALWFKPSGSNNDDEMLLSRRRYNGDNDQVSMQISYLSDGRVRMLFGADQSPGVLGWSASACNDGNWHHIAVVRDTAVRRMRIYIDGVLEAEAEDNDWDASAASSCRIGQEGETYGGNRQYHGLIDDVRIYNKAVTPGPAPQVMVVQVFCPVDITVFDPEGRVICRDFCTIPLASYIEEDLNGDGDPDDKVIIPDALEGQYLVQVTPEPGASPTATYTLQVVLGNATTTITENELVQNIPPTGYALDYADGNVTVLTPTYADVTNAVTISFIRAPRTSRTTAAFDVTVTNDSGDALKAPVKLVIDNITSGVTVANPDGTGEADEPFAGEPYFTLLDTGELAPGTSTDPRRIVFSNPGGVRFTFEVSCWAMTVSGSIPAPPREQRLFITIPSESALAQNYPNPFNPDTWIPYELCEDSNVSISIYDISGRLVRKLELGHRNAGVYMSRDRAAYWDGRNEVGEKVASGVYFYSIKAGYLLDTRKLAIVK